MKTIDARTDYTMVAPVCCQGLSDYSSADLCDLKSIGAPFPVDQTYSIEYVLLPIHRRISLQRAETQRINQACS
jgi:hypothetical protein